MSNAAPLAADWYGIDFRREPYRYRIGRGEQGVLTAEPYKSEILPHWKFKTPDVAQTSAVAIWNLYMQYRRKRDYVGMDMCRKFIMMGWTRSRRYANHKTGKKYVGAVPVEKRGISGAHGRAVAALDPDPVKAECAEIFKVFLDQIKADEAYKTAVKVLRIQYAEYLKGQR